MKIEKKKISFLSEKQKIDGTLVKPIIVRNKIPGVIFFHGMTSSEKGYVPIAERLAKKGIYAMTLSIRGHGNSEGDFKKLKVPNGVQDGLNAYDFFSKHNFIDENRIGLCCSSVGAVIVCIVSKQKKVRSLILKAPAIYTKKMMTMTYDQTMLREDIMFKEIRNATDTPAMKAISQFKGSLLAILSEKDGIIPTKMQEQYLVNAKKATRKKKIVIKDADHPLTKKKWKDEFIIEMQKWFISTL